MRLTFCAACGSTDDLQHHHLVARSEGGSNDETNLITLCYGCHAKLHERRSNGVYNHRARTLTGLAAVKARIEKTGQEKRPDINALAIPISAKRSC
jgi:5-methylcytosine-specific restriction endonuclease McrA